MMYTIQFKRNFYSWNTVVTKHANGAREEYYLSDTICTKLISSRIKFQKCR